MSKENYSISFYQQRIEELDVDLRKYTQLSRMWVVVRLSFFVMLCAHAYFSFPYSLYAGIALIGMIVLFLFFVRKSIENKERLNFVKRLIQLNENEIKAAQFDYSAFGDGEAYKESNHPYSYDMDLFGERSFFQLFNRTVTFRGEKALVNRFLKGIADPDKSTSAIEELTEKMEWCQEYLNHGSLLEKDEVERSVTEVLSEGFSIKSWMNVLRFVLPIIAFAICVAYYFDIINGFQFLLGAVVLLLPIRQLLKTTNRVHKVLVDQEHRVTAMRNQLDILKELEVESELLKDYQETLFLKDKSANQGLEQLSKLVKESGYRDNILVAIFLNFFFAWDIRLLLNLYKWKEDFNSQLEAWEEILFEMEALISGAVYRYNYRQSTSVPMLSDATSGGIELVDIGHPIIPLEKLVKNNFILTSEESFAIITGPNMAGKSTFLRAVGINLILARAGYHVMAKKFVFPDMNLYSSMRNSDDLKEETSYFHAELLRLRFIVDAIERGEKVFIILDEILKGTNSKDKEEGSAKFLRKLNQLGARGIIATHDLSLTELAEVDSALVNKYFDTEIQGDEISFDYTIRDGVAKNMNASFLLKKMGLIDG